jgi:hypothetical protein
MEGVLPWLVRWTRYAGTIDFCHALASQPSTKYYFSYRTLFQFISSHRPATWEGSRAGSPVSLCLWTKLTPCPPPPIQSLIKRHLSVLQSS